MKNLRPTPSALRLRAGVLAVHGVLGLLAGAQAQSEPTVAELTQARSELEVGLAGASDTSAKANEYTGLNRRGPSLVGGFEWRGGGAWDSGDALRWQLGGARLGTRSAELAAEVGVQGRYRLRLEADELRRIASDSYQTPYLGVGGNVLRLPADWVPVVVPRVNATTPNARGLAPAVTASDALVGGVARPPTAAQAAAAAALQAADLPAFRGVDLFTQRTRHALGWSHEIDTRWGLSATVSREHKSGLKATGAQSRATNGDTSSILPLPIDQDDNQVQLGLHYTGDALQFQAGYEDSAFTNHVPSIGWNLWAAPTLNATAATAPSNRFRKLALSGSWRAGEFDTLVGHAALSRATQDDPFLADATAPLVPVASAQALVVSRTAGLKWLSRVSPRLNLSAAYKFDERDNRTPVNTYGFYDNDNAPTGASPFAALFPGLTGLGQNFNFNANTPYSRRVNQLDADADYQVARGQHLKLGLQAQNTTRECHGSWINCADAPRSHENTLRLDWRGELGEDLSARAGVVLARRRVSYDENAFLAVVPMAAQSPATATGPLAGSSAYGTLVALGLTGYGPVSGLQPVAAPGSALAFYFPNNNVLNNLLYGNENRISELPGLQRFDQADRRRARLRGSATWQASRQWSLQAGLDVGGDHHDRSVYGLQRSSSWALNLDGHYQAGDRLSLAVFGTFEDQRRRTAGNTYTANSTATAVNGATAIEGGCFATIALRNASNKIDPCLDWTARQHDRTLTLGASVDATGLLAGQLDLTGSAAFSRGRTDIDVTGGNYVNNPLAGVAGAPTRDIAAFYVPASALPTSLVNAFELNLTGTWRLGPRQAMRLTYGYQQLRSSDWATEALQDGGLTQVLPTREQAPAYHLHRIGVSYVLGF